MIMQARRQQSGPGPAAAEEATVTPEERNLINDLFDRLASVENSERDPEAEAAIRDGLQRAPHAVYALVQTALVQDEALKRADARIREFESKLGSEGQQPHSGSFLGAMREALTGRRGSVPTVPPTEAPMGAPPQYRGPSAPPMAAGPGYALGPGYAPGPASGGPGVGGGSFLGNAAATAAGVVGGSLLLDSIRGMMGHRQGLGGFGQTPGSAVAGEPGSPWVTAPTGGGGNLAHEAGLDDIRAGSDPGRPDKSQGALGGDQLADDTQQGEDADYQENADYQDDGDLEDSGDFDDGGDFGGDSTDE
jgi:uncharacterized protein